MHHRDQGGSRIDGCPRVLDARPAVNIHPDARHAHSVPLQPRAGLLRRRVLDRSRYDVSSIVTGFDHATDREIVGLRASRCEDHFVIIATQQRRHLASRPSDGIVGRGPKAWPLDGFPKCSRRYGSIASTTSAVSVWWRCGRGKWASLRACAQGRWQQLRQKTSAAAQAVSPSAD
jgi:hypothetical protein